MTNCKYDPRPAHRHDVPSAGYPSWAFDAALGQARKEFAATPVTYPQFRDRVWALAAQFVIKARAAKEEQAPDTFDTWAQRQLSLRSNWEGEILNRRWGKAFQWRPLSDAGCKVIARDRDAERFFKNASRQAIKDTK